MILGGNAVRTTKREIIIKSNDKFDYCSKYMNSQIDVNMICEDDRKKNKKQDFKSFDVYYESDKISEINKNLLKTWNMRLKKKDKNKDEYMTPSMILVKNMMK